MKKLLIGNLKMNLLSPTEREDFLKLFKEEIKKSDLKNTEIVMCPSAVHLEKFVEYFRKNGIDAQVGAQNVFWKREGAYTGEISPRMISNLGAKWSLVGHSERRIYLGETDEMINFKIKEILKNGLKTIFCVGENEDERRAGLIQKVLARQITVGLRDVLYFSLEKIILAYEPVWAIGTGKTPSVNDIMEARLLIKKTIAEKYGLKTAEKIQIVYGGSVSAANVTDVCLKTGMDGVLVGGASLDQWEFLKIAKKIDG